MKFLNFKIIFFVVVVGVSGAVYLKTVCPGVYWYDSGEFITACYTLGIPHYPGYPLYCLLGKLFSWAVPWGSVAFRVNLVSCVCAAFTVGFIYLAMEALSLSRIIAVVCALCFAFSSGFWSQATIAEVYTLHTLLTALLILGLVHLTNSPGYRPGSGNRWLVFTGLVFGLGLAHHLSIVFFLPAVLYVILSGRMFEKENSGTGKCSSLGGVVITFCVCWLPGLLFYLYLPIRSLYNPVLDWGDPENLNNFITHVTMTPYRATESFSLSLSQIMCRMAELGRLYISQFSFAGIIAALFGTYALFKKNRRLTIFLLWVISAEWFYALFLNTVSLKATLFGLPAYMSLIFLAGAGVEWIFVNLKLGKLNGNKVQPQGWSGWAGMAVIVTLPIFFFKLNFPIEDKSRCYAAQDYVNEVIEPIQGPAAIITAGDNDFFPLFCRHHVEQKGRDTLVICQELITSRYAQRWYLKQLKAAYLTPAGGTKKGTGFDIFLNFKLPEPGDYYDSESLSKIINNKFSENDVINKIIEENIDRFRIYTTNPDIVKAEYLLPAGPIYLVTARPLETFAPEDNGLNYYYRLANRINSLRVQGQIDDPSLQVYAELFNNAGVYYYRRKMVQEALFSYREAIRMNPGYAQVYYNLGVLYKQLGEKALAGQMFHQALKQNLSYESAGDALKAVTE